MAILLAAEELLQITAIVHETSILSTSPIDYDSRLRIYQFGAPLGTLSFLDGRQWRVLSASDMPMVEEDALCRPISAWKMLVASFQGEIV